MSIEPCRNIQAETALESATESASATQAAREEWWKAVKSPEVQAVTAAVRKAFQELLRPLRKDSPEFRKLFQDLSAAIAAADAEIEAEFASRHLPVPKVIEDWEKLARIVGIPKDSIGGLTGREIYDRALEWVEEMKIEVERRKILAKLMADAGVEIGAPPTPSSPSASETKEATQHPFIFCRAGTRWFIRGFGEEGYLPDLRGFQYLARLLEDPKGVVKMRALVAGFGVDDKLAPEPGSDAVIDQEARKEYRERRAELKDEITEARRKNDLVLVDQLKQEKQWIDGQLKAAKGRGGRPRKLGDNRDKLRSQITNAVRTACNNLEECGLENLADHFRSCTSADGDTYTYHPKERPDWQFSK